MKHFNRPLVAALTAVTAAFPMFAACTGATGDAGTKAGGSARPITLQIGTEDSTGIPGGDAVAEFVKQVEKISGGRVTVEPVWHAAGTPTPRSWDQVVAGRVVSGDLDLALVGSRAWDTEGVDSLRPINAPFLITSESVLDSVLSSDLAPQLMAGLEDVGVTGLTLLPEGMRHVFGWGRAPTTPADFDGELFRTPRSDTVSDVYQALGARVDDPDGAEFADGAADGTIAGAETSLVLAGQLPGRSPTTAGNLVLYPKVQSLVANTDMLDHLTDEQRTALEQAAQATQQWVLGRATTDAEAAQKFCDIGGRVVLADPSDIEALEAATRPAYDALADDPETGPLVTGIEQMRNATDPDPTPTACDPEPDPTGSTASSGDGGTFPEGVYRINVSAEDLVAAGAGEVWAGDVAGQWTLTFENGQLTSTDVNARSGLSYTAKGAYCVEDDRLQFDLFGEEDVCGDGVYFDAAWHAEDKGVRFLDVKPMEGEVPADVGALYGSTLWLRIG